MGGEGSMMAANNSLKNNRSLVAKRKETKALSGSYANAKIKEFPKASEEDLIKIRERILLKNKQNMLKVYVVLGVFLVIVIGFIFYLKI